MHFSSILLLAPLLSSLVTADQVPFVGKATEWFDKAKSFLPNQGPVDAGAAYVAEHRVERINIRNWQRKLAPKLDTEEEWLIFVTGGNKSCFGRCGHAEATWNLSVPLLAPVQAASAKPLHLAILDCDRDEIVCTAWGTTLPSIYHFDVPKKTEPQAKVPLHVVPLNMSSATTADILSIPSATKARYLDFPEYEGAVHPFDGWLAKFNLLIPFGYVMWGFGSTPSWLMMLGISFVSRQIMSRRMGARTGVPTPGAAAPAPPPQAQTPSRPAGGTPRSGGSKKRR
ncbi:hypothetical protein LTR84_012309 [Exophiala bonariae]|uniref:Uncharacterized protein n=1 Tax=Exophiala bonariae TaxID=1690606 RepID=A0AAV9NFU4_9EURO|nr:hypothetical protein LTR84_012309 [Exophiala bonariae]